MHESPAPQDPGRDEHPSGVPAGSGDYPQLGSAEELRKAGLDGTMDQLRARAYLDILLGIDSRPQASPNRDSRDPNGSPGGAPIPKQIRRIVTGPWHGTGRSQDWHRSVSPVQSTGKATRVPVRRDLVRVGRIASVVMPERVHLATQ
jgi:hypothetical protein